ncbi:mechanosensitive ion channel family protein [Enterococcus sp. CSURQ0835]|uniref:mechanosensitive ion channel family protein n=1 Tax=Enterococcus sp. CSURQ0835 TaxID=2681394 RepID=UPI001358431E|nr:mechanosensitive ion channel family protein [Enterococcus sp. CSURQ0835]
MFLLTAQTTDSTSINVVDKASNQLNTWQRYWQSIDWDHILSVIIQKAMVLLVIIILFAIIRKVGGFLITRSFESQIRKIAGSSTRLETIHTLTRNVFNYILFFFFLYSILDTLGVPVGSLLAGAGIAGIAIGLGAQGFMNDIITGFFIILEQQINVGDYIKLVNLQLEGTVTSVGIRTIKMKSNDGTVHFIPNRNITTISNLSRAHMQVILDIRIKPDEGYDAIIALIQEVNQHLASEFSKEIFDGPNFFGMVDLGNGNYALRTTMYVVNGRQYKLKEEFLAGYVRTLSQHGFSIPNNPIYPVK